VTVCNTAEINHLFGEIYSRYFPGRDSMFTARSKTIRFLDFPLMRHPSYSLRIHINTTLIKPFSYIPEQFEPVRNSSMSGRKERLEFQ